jgi:Family of unknown function (DUF5631)/Family of unknown function (DUF5632)
MVTAETAPLVRYLKADLQRIVNSANEELKNIRCAGLVDSTRQAEEARVVNEARAFAVRRVESTVRHFHTIGSKSPIEHRPVDGVDEPEKTPRFKLAPPQPDPEPTAEIPIVEPAPVSQAASTGRHQQPEEPFEPPQPFEPPTPVDETLLHESELAVSELGEPVTAKARAAHALPEPDVPEPEDVAPDVVQSERSAPRHAIASDESDEFDESDDTEVFEQLSTLLEESAPPAQPPIEPPPPTPPPPAVAQPPSRDADAARPLPVAASAELAESSEPPESERERLERVLKFVARQEPGLRWAVGIRDDGSTLIVTDLAHGWIPPGINLPADIALLKPGRRKGNAATLLGRTTSSATYAPGDPLGWATDYEVTNISSRPRELPAVDDLGWVLGEATHWRDGLPRMVNTLAKAGAAGTGIVEAEIDILRVYLDTSRYQLLGQYPDVDAGLLLNCLLLAATEGIATQNAVTANYHFAWFQVLSSPPASGWQAGR